MSFQSGIRERIDFIACTKKTGVPDGERRFENAKQPSWLTAAAAADLDAELADVVFEAVVVDAEEQLPVRGHRHASSGCRSGTPGRCRCGAISAPAKLRGSGAFGRVALRLRTGRIRRCRSVSPLSWTSPVVLNVSTSPRRTVMPGRRPRLAGRHDEAAAGRRLAARGRSCRSFRRRRHRCARGRCARLRWSQRRARPRRSAASGAAGEVPPMSYRLPLMVSPLRSQVTC